MEFFTITLNKLIPWTDTNENEDEVEVTFDGQTWRCYTILLDPERWSTLHIGQQYEVGLELEPVGEIAVIDHPVAYQFQHIEHTLYEVTGQVQRRTRNYLEIQSRWLITAGFIVPIHDPAYGQSIQIGDYIHMQATLQIYFDPDAEDRLLDDS